MVECHTPSVGMRTRSLLEIVHFSVKFTHLLDLSKFHTCLMGDLSEVMYRM